MFEDIERRFIYTSGRKVWELVIRIEKAMKMQKTILFLTLEKIKSCEGKEIYSSYGTCSPQCLYSHRSVTTDY